MEIPAKIIPIAVLKLYQYQIINVSIRIIAAINYLIFHFNSAIKKNNFV